MYSPITITKDSKFFVMLCKDADSVHSYVSIGVEVDNKPVLLGAYGKIIGKDSNSCKFFFSNTSARINNERLFYSPDEKESINSSMTYKAYSIKYENYLEFLQYMKAISIQQKKDCTSLMAYYPVEENTTNNTIILGWNRLNTFKPNDTADISNDSIEKKHFRIGKTNTCRHSAINFTKKASKLDNLGKGVSSFFGFSPPLKTSVSAGVLGVDNQHLYILPLPPKSFPNLNKNKLAIIKKLYTRLDEIILTDQYNRNTTKKFEQIKALYESLTAKETSNLNDVFKEISSWFSENKELMATHRKPHLFSFKTTTQNMFIKILKNQPKPGENEQPTPGSSSQP